MPVLIAGMLEGALIGAAIGAIVGGILFVIRQMRNTPDDSK